MTGKLSYNAVQKTLQFMQNCVYVMPSHIFSKGRQMCPHVYILCKYVVIYAHDNPGSTGILDWGWIWGELRNQVSVMWRRLAFNFLPIECFITFNLFTVYIYVYIYLAVNKLIKCKTILVAFFRGGKDKIDSKVLLVPFEKQPWLLTFRNNN